MMQRLVWGMALAGIFIGVGRALAVLQKPENLLTIIRLFSMC